MVLDGLDPSQSERVHNKNTIVTAICNGPVIIPKSKYNWEKKFQTNRCSSYWTGGELRGGPAAFSTRASSTNQTELLESAKCDLSQP